MSQDKRKSGWLESLRKRASEQTNQTDSEGEAQAQADQSEPGVHEGRFLVLQSGDNQALAILARGNGPFGSVVMSNVDAFKSGLSIATKALEGHTQGCQDEACGVTAWLSFGQELLRDFSDVVGGGEGATSGIVKFDTEPKSLDQIGEMLKAPIKGSGSGNGMVN